MLENAVKPRTPEKVKLELLVRYFRALGDPTRVKILQYLVDGPKNVGEIVATVGSLQGRVSSHLACLRWCGFVSSYRDGKFIYYQITDKRARELLAVADSMIADNAEYIWSCTHLGANSSNRDEIETTEQS